MEPRTAIVTGSSRGVGAATAYLFAERGYNVVLNCSTSAAAAEEVAARCLARGARDVLLVQCDLSTAEGCHKLVDEAVARFGTIDTLINNAGTTKFVSHYDLEGLSPKDFSDIFNLNVQAPFLLTRRAAPHLRRGGSVVMVSSVAGLHGIGSSIAYAASKGALNSMTKALARVLGHQNGVRVNAVCPGFIRGEWLRKGLGERVYDAAAGGYAAQTPLHSTLGPEDVAATVVAVASNMPLVTGQLVAVDSGMGLSVIAEPPGTDIESRL
eukprot:g2299.t1